MKAVKTIIAIFLLLSTLLFASGDYFDQFIDNQINVEAKLLDQNLTAKEREEILNNQDTEYRQFFLDFATDEKNYAPYVNPYRNTMSKLRIQMNYNEKRGYTLAYMRDKVRLYQYLIRSGIRQLMHQLLQEIENHSKPFFEEIVDELILKAFSAYTPLNKEEYLKTIDKTPESPLAIQVKEELRRLDYMDSLANSFSAHLIESASSIYNAGKIANSKFFSLISTINQNTLIKSLNEYLSFIHLDAAMVMMFLIFALFITLVNLLIKFIADRILHYYKVSDEDIEHFHASITKIIYYITTLMIVHLAMIFYFGADTKSITISKFFAVLYIILIAILLYRFSNMLAYFKMEKLEKGLILKKEVFNLLVKVNNAMIFLTAIIAILIVFGVDLTALLSGLGIGGFAVAFAAKDSISNIFGSVSILLSDLFEQGDWIETDGIDGTVVEIGLRATTLRTFDNALISIPNFKLANSDIKNWSRRTIGRRIKMKIGVTYESDFDDILRAIQDIRNMLKEHQAIAGSGTKYSNKYRSAKLVSVEDFKGIKRNILVYMDEFADSSITILVYCFSRTVVWAEWLDIKQDIMLKIAKILKKNNLEFAYPTLTIHQAENNASKEERSEQKSGEEPQISTSSGK